MDCRQLGVPRKRWYQRSERKGGGKLRYSAPLKETMTMITTGAIRNNSTAPAIAMTTTTPGPVLCPSSAIMRRGQSSPSLEDALEPDEAVVADETHKGQRQE